MAYFLLSYELAADYLERRDPYREPHMSAIAQAAERGELVLGGVLADPVDTALFVFRSDTPAVAEAFAHADPYVSGGVVRAWHIRPWIAFLGLAN